jgi:hypothetical protein
MPGNADERAFRKQERLPKDAIIRVAGNKRYYLGFSQ